MNVAVRCIEAVWNRGNFDTTPGEGHSETEISPAWHLQLMESAVEAYEIAPGLG